MDDSFAQRGRTLRRGKTLSRPERFQAPEPMLKGGKDDKSSWDIWVLFSWLTTFWAPSFILKKVGLPMDDMVQAWREKFALCFIITLICAAVVFLTFFLPIVFCPPESRDAVGTNLIAISNKDGSKVMPGYYIIDTHVFSGSNPTTPSNFPIAAEALYQYPDISSYFRKPDGYDNLCKNIQFSNGDQFNAVQFDPCNKNNGNGGCIFPPIQDVYEEYNISPAKLTNGKGLYKAGYAWNDVGTNFVAIDNVVLDLSTYMSTYPQPIPNDKLDAAIRKALSSKVKDATRILYRDADIVKAIPCLKVKFASGTLQSSSAGCFGVDFFMTLSLIVIISIIGIRFAMAFVFHWFISHQLSRRPKSNKHRPMAVVKDSPYGESKLNRQISDDPNELFTILLVTCYSEGELSMRTTVESLASTEYADDKKLLFIVADGIITGSGNDKSTPDICVDMIEIDPTFGESEPQSYIAVASGMKQHNRAKVYAGHFLYKDRRIPTLLVIKSGNPDEVDKPKAGNRGKRDSQLILMNFFSRVIYNERMTPLDYDMFRKIHHLMGVTPDHFETVLMVDADTKVYPDSLKLLTYCLINDPLIMGLCGETKIANKRDSWVTAIQVFEYYISHHLGKGFESVFGGVTCLPGCFCMYRLKAPKGENEWVPIITKPEIVQEYSQNIVETLHQKNLLLLGEDRFLTTLMLRNFPNRKMMFMPQAVCKTVVPDEFAVLLSQRRRWINSTIHNLLELVLVRNLCGTFCFSMQFVIFMELIGTVVLPVAIIMTFVLIITIAQTKITLATCMPLVMLLLVLFSPALLILITSRKLIYVAWMFIYLLALPVWNFILPVYSYWHFDDFSWGATRMVEGEGKGDAHGKKEGEFDSSKVSLRRWEEYERRRRRSIRRKERQAKEESGRKLNRNYENDSDADLMANNSTNSYYDDDDADSNRSHSLDIGPQQQQYQYGSGVGAAIGNSYDSNNNYNHSNDNSNGDGRDRPMGPRPFN